MGVFGHEDGSLGLCCSFPTETVVTEIVWEKMCGDVLRYSLNFEEKPSHILKCNQMKWGWFGLHLLSKIRIIEKGELFMCCFNFISLSNWTKIKASPPSTHTHTRRLNKWIELTVTLRIKKVKYVIKSLIGSQSNDVIVWIIKIITLQKLLNWHIATKNAFVKDHEKIPGQSFPKNKNIEKYLANLII